MAVLTKAHEIRALFTRMTPLAAGIEALRLIVARSRSRPTKKSITAAYRNLREMFAGASGQTPSRIREAVDPTSGGPSREWSEWFCGVVARRDLNSAEAQAMGARFDDLTREFSGIVEQLPCKIRRTVSPEFGISYQPWFTQARVSFPGDRSELLLPEGISVDATDEPSVHIARRLWWDRLRQIPLDGRWTIEWADIPSIIQSITDALDRSRREGIEDFATTEQDVNDALNRVLARAPEWFPRGDGQADPRSQKLLDAGLLIPPIDFSVSWFRAAVLRELWPNQVPRDRELIERVVTAKVKSEELVTRPIQYACGGSLVPITQSFFCRGTGDANTVPNEKVSPPADPPNLEIDEDTRQVQWRGIVLRISRRGFDLVQVLRNATGHVVPYLELLTTIRPNAASGGVTRLEAAPPEVSCEVSRLNRTLTRASCPLRISNVRGRGYRLILAT